METTFISKMQLHTCPECDKLFLEESELLIHVLNHPFEKIYVCDKLFNDEEQHKYQTKEDGYVREVSNKRVDEQEQLDTIREYRVGEVNNGKFGEGEQLTEYLHTHKGENHYVFDDIFDEKEKLMEPFLTQEKRSAHEVGKERFDRQKFKEPFYTHAINNEKLEEEQKLNEHLHTNMKNKVYICGICSKSFSEKLKIKEHLVIHQEDSLTCEVCNKKFSTKPNLMKHRSTHKKKHVCKTCGASFRANSFLRIHMFLHNMNKSPKPLEKHYALGVDKKTFLCKSFPGKVQLKQHCTSHKKEKNLKCDVCEKAFSSSGKLERHLVTHNNNMHNEDKCGMDKKMFSSSWESEKNLITHNNKCNEDKSGMRKKAFSSLSELERCQTTLNDKDSDDKCDMCENEFLSLGELKRHLMTHNNNHKGDKPLPVTSKTFGEGSSEPENFQKDGHERKKVKIRLSSKRSLRTYDKPFVCNVCGKAFVWRSWLEEHSMVHTKEKNHVCGMCEKTYTLKKDLKTHLLKTHRLCVCKTCGERFPGDENFQKHLQSHEKEKISLSTDKSKKSYDKTFACNVCGKAFAWRSKLKQHSVSHRKEKKYKCEICEQVFSRKDHRKRHLRKTHLLKTHRLCTCKTCGERFPDNGKFQKHLQSHEREKISLNTDESKKSCKKRVACNVCGKAFAWRSKLKRHFVSHTKEKKYKCEICEKVFSRKDHRKRHLRKIHLIFSLPIIHHYLSSIS